MSGILCGLGTLWIPGKAAHAALTISNLPNMAAATPIPSCVDQHRLCRQHGLRLFQTYMGRHHEIFHQRCLNRRATIREFSQFGQLTERPGVRPAREQENRALRYLPLLKFSSSLDNSTG